MTEHTIADMSAVVDELIASAMASDLDAIEVARGELFALLGAMLAEGSKEGDRLRALLLAWADEATAAEHEYYKSGNARAFLSTSATDALLSEAHKLKAERDALALEGEW